MFETFRDKVFPFIKNLSRNSGSAYNHLMKDAVFIIPTPALLERVVTMISGIPMEARDTKGDLYEYLLSKIAQAGVNGQFRTPRHIINMMVELVEPRPEDVICDPACGTCGFLVLAGEYLREKHPQMFRNKKQRDHFQSRMFHGADFDASMLRIGNMNMMLHGIDNPAIKGILRASPRSIDRLRPRGELRPVRILNCVRFNPDEGSAFVARQKAGPSYSLCRIQNALKPGASPLLLGRPRLESQNSAIGQRAPAKPNGECHVLRCQVLGVPQSDRDI